MKIRQSHVLAAVVGALGIVTTSVAAFAAVPIPDAKGVIRACVKLEDINKYEQMRWITRTTCPKGEKLIAWNQKGPTGPKGAKGDLGIQGVPGSNAPVPHVVTESVDLPSANTFGTSALCPDGEHAIAGGGYDSSLLLVMQSSRPFTSGSDVGWNVVWVTRDGSSLDPSTIETYATCIAD